MTIEFPIRQRDHYRATRALQRRMSSQRWAAAFFVGLPMVLFVTFLVRGDSLREVLVQHAGAVLGGPALFFLGFPFLNWWTVRSQHRTNPQLRGTQIYDLRTDELRMSGGLSSVTMKWEAVVAVVETQEFFLIYIGKDRAYFIPKSALAGPSELDALRTLLRERVPGRFHAEKGAAGPIARAA